MLATTGTEYILCFAVVPLKHAHSALCVRSRRRRGVCLQCLVQKQKWKHLSAVARRAGRASSCVLGTLELLGHNTKRIFNELPLLVCLKKRDAKHGNVRRRRRMARQAALLVCFTPTLFVAVLLKVGNLGTHNSSFLRITKSRDNLRDWRFLYALIFKLGKRRWNYITQHKVFLELNKTKSKIYQIKFGWQNLKSRFVQTKYTNSSWNTSTICFKSTKKNTSRVKDACIFTWYVWK